MPEIFSNPIWVTVFICIIAVLCVLIVELNYRIFAKKMLDLIVSGIAIVICSPILIVLAIISYKREGYVLQKRACLGQKGKVILISQFSGFDGGIGQMARLFDIFTGKISFVGVNLMPVEDGALISDEDMERFTARSGLVNNLVLGGSESLTYEESFKLEIRYAKKCGLFRDIWIIIKTLVYILRGENRVYMGEVAEKTYGEALLERGEITAEQYEEAIKLARSPLPNQL